MHAWKVYAKAKTLTATGSKAVACTPKALEVSEGGSCSPDSPKLQFLAFVSHSLEQAFSSTLPQGWSLVGVDCPAHSSADSSW